jgi:hypothetical protein
MIISILNKLEMFFFSRMPYNKYKKYLTGLVKKPKTTISRHNRKITINESSEIEMNIQDEQNSAVLKNEDTVVNIELDV